MLIFAYEGLHIVFGEEAVRADIVVLGSNARALELLLVESIAFNRIFVGKTLGACELEQAVVGLRSHGVVLNFDNLTEFGADKGGRVVAVAEGFAVFAGAFAYEFFTDNRLCIHSHESGHAVAAVNVKALSHRAEAVSGVNVAAVALVVAQTPAEFVAFAVLPIVVPEWAQIVDISALSANYFAKHALLSHVERVHFKPVVAAVFENHAVHALGFAQVDELPALVEVHSSRHFYCHVFAIFHSAFSHGEVVIPVGANIHEVDIGAFAEFHITVFAAIDIGERHACALQIALAVFGTFFFIVAESFHFHAWDIHKSFHSRRSAHTETHESYSHHFDFWASHAYYVLLTGRAFGRFGNDGVACPVPLSVG